MFAAAILLVLTASAIDLPAWAGLAAGRPLDPAATAAAASGNRLGQTALLMRTTSRFLTEYREEYLYSLRLFWPRRHLFQLVVLDEERAEDQAAAPALRDELAGLGIRGEVLFEPDNDWRRTPGHTCVGLTAHASFS